MPGLNFGASYFVVGGFFGGGMTQPRIFSLLRGINSATLLLSLRAIGLYDNKIGRTLFLTLFWSDY